MRGTKACRIRATSYIALPVELGPSLLCAPFLGNASAFKMALAGHKCRQRSEGCRGINEVDMQSKQHAFGQCHLRPLARSANMMPQIVIGGGIVGSSMRGAAPHRDKQQYRSSAACAFHRSVAARFIIKPASMADLPTMLVASPSKSGKRF